MFFTVTNTGCRFWSEIHEFCNGIRCLAFCPRFKKFPEGNEGQNHGGRFKIEVSCKVVESFHVSDAKSNGHSVDGIHTENCGSTGAKGYRRIHIRGAGKQCSYADSIIFEINKNDRNGEPELDECICDCIGNQRLRKRKAHHIPHRQIKQR